MVSEPRLGRRRQSKSRGKRTDLENAVLSALLLAEDVERLGFVARSDDPVRDFARDDLGGRDIASVREGDKVAKRRHAVGACFGVGWFGISAPRSSSHSRIRTCQNGPRARA